jgi:hypothetical protein
MAVVFRLNQPAEMKILTPQPTADDEAKKQATAGKKPEPAKAAPAKK